MSGSSPQHDTAPEESPMDARFTEEDESFRKEIAGWLEQNLSGEFEVVRGRGLK